jgi:hypothetical protein
VVASRKSGTIIRLNMLRGAIQLLWIIGVTFCAVGCDVRSGVTAQPSSKSTTNPSNVAASRESSQVDPLTTAIELQQDPVGGWVQRSEENPKIYELVSKYRGKLYVVAASVAEVDYRLRFRLQSITDPSDNVFFRVVSGESIPSHPGRHVLKLAFDALNSGYKFKQGEILHVAFTGTGQYIALWSADLTVVPGMWNPRYEDPSDDRPKQPPTFQLIAAQPGSAGIDR